MIAATYRRLLTWLATHAGLVALTEHALSTRLERAYLDGWHDAELRQAARGPCAIS